MNFQLVEGLHAEKFADEILVLVPNRSEVLHLSGDQAEAFRLAEFGAQTVPGPLEPAMAGLCSLGIVESHTWSRRRILQMGGAAAAAAVVVTALPSVAAASSTTATTAPPTPVHLEERSSNFPTYRIQVSGGPTIGRIIDTTTPAGAGYTNVKVVSGLEAGTNHVSFQEVDSTGNPTSPSRYLAPSGFNFSNAPSSALPVNTLDFQMVPTGVTEAANFAKLATYTQISPGNDTGVTGGHSFQSLVNSAYYVRHAGFVLRVHTGSGSLFNADSTFTTVSV